MSVRLLHHDSVQLVSEAQSTQLAFQSGQQHLRRTRGLRQAGSTCTCCTLASLETVLPPQPHPPSGSLSCVLALCSSQAAGPLLRVLATACSRSKVPTWESWSCSVPPHSRLDSAHLRPARSTGLGKSRDAGPQQRCWCMAVFSSYNITSDQDVWSLTAQCRALA